MDKIKQARVFLYEFKKLAVIFHLYIYIGATKMAFQAQEH